MLDLLDLLERNSDLVGIYPFTLLLADMAHGGRAGQGRCFWIPCW
ncbi:hypothetical protein [Sagittula sp. S175]